MEKDLADSKFFFKKKKKEFLSKYKEFKLVVNIRNSSPFSYIHFWPGFAILTFISRVVMGVKNTETNVYS